MLDDWQNDTCVGKYLKTIFENRISKDNDKKDRRGDKHNGLLQEGMWPISSSL